MDPNRRQLSQALRSLNHQQPDAYLILEWKGSSNYFQCLRTRHGFIVESRFYESDVQSPHVHYRAWSSEQDPFDAGEVDPRSGEHGPWVRERDFISCESTELLFHILLQEQPTTPPTLSRICWREVTDEFPNVEG